MSRARFRMILDIIATDNTWHRARAGIEEVWTGKCIHCNRKLVVELGGNPAAA